MRPGLLDGEDVNGFTAVRGVRLRVSTGTRGRTTKNMFEHSVITKEQQFQTRAFGSTAIFISKKHLFKLGLELAND
jgi:hypothetical protein